MNHADQEFEALWASFRDELSSEAERFDIDAHLADAFSQARRHAEDLIPKHLIALREAASAVLLLDAWLSDCEPTRQRNAFLSQLCRASNSIVCIRFLLESGFDETARPLIRNYLETLDIAIAAYVNEEFAAELFSAEGEGFDSLWKNKIGYGKINRYLKEACRVAGLDEDCANEFIEIRRQQKTLLSASVHADDAGAFRSLMVPVLGHPDTFSLSRRGVVSSLTPNQIIGLVGETYRFLSLVLKTILSGWDKCPFEPARDGQAFGSFIVQVFAFQDYYQNTSFPDGEHIRAEGANQSTGVDG